MRAALGPLLRSGHCSSRRAPGSTASRCQIGPPHNCRALDIESRSTQREEQPTGALALGAAGPGTAHFGHHAYRPTTGLGLVVHGLPRALRHGRTLSLRVTDAFGTAAAGLQVHAVGLHHFRIAALTDAKGRVAIATPEGFRGTLRFTFGGPAYVKLRRTLKVR